jgi:hypothetical protein
MGGVIIYERCFRDEVDLEFEKPGVDARCSRGALSAKKKRRQHLKR